MSKGSKTRPINKIEFDKNYDTIFGRKYTVTEAKEMYDKAAEETCLYCGILTDNPCDAPQNSCEQAINKTFGKWLNDLNRR